VGTNQQGVSQPMDSLLRADVVGKDLEAGYQQMAQDEAREAEALQWAEATVQFDWENRR